MKELTKLGAAIPGDLVRHGTYRARGLGGSGNIPEVDHVGVVDHRYGHSGHLLWIVPICGSPAGRADTSATGKLCKKCIAKAEKEGINV